MAKEEVKISKPWYKSKTVWTGIGGIVATLGAYFTGEMDLQVALPALVTSLGLIFLRSGIEKNK